MLPRSARASAATGDTRASIDRTVSVATVPATSRPLARRCAPCGVHGDCDPFAEPITRAGYRRGGLVGPEEPAPPRLLERRYRIVHRLGAGGMGRVMLAIDLRLGRQVAVKAPSPREAASDLARLRNEARLMALVSHVGVVRLFDCREQHQPPYLVMEYLEGETLGQRLGRNAHRGLGLDEAVGFTTQLCGALAAVHGAGVVHGDVKPANVVVLGGSQVVLIDFGLARPMDQPFRGLMAGTPRYMPPEDVAGRPLVGEAAGRSDIYSLGVTLFEMLTGRPPFCRGTEQEVLRAQLLTPPPSLAALRPDLPPALAVAIERTLAKDPAERPGSCGELNCLLRRAGSGDLARRAPLRSAGSRACPSHRAKRGALADDGEQGVGAALA